MLNLENANFLGRDILRADERKPGVAKCHAAIHQEKDPKLPSEAVSKFPQLGKSRS